MFLIDERGKIANGDQLMGLIASQWAAAGRLAHNTLVATVMSNMGLEQYLRRQDIKMLRTNVGDRYVVSAMRDGGYNLGGEQSGHIVMGDHVTTGDGLMAALQFLDAMIASDQPASHLLNVFEPWPQLMKNITFEKGTDPLADPSVRKAIETGETALGDNGRLLIRKSGTEPLIRVMGEGQDETLIDQTIDHVVDAIKTNF